MKLTIRIPRDSECSAIRFIEIYLILNALNSFVQDVFSVSESMLSLIQFAMMVVLAILILYMIYCMNRAQISKFILMELCALITYGYSFACGVSMSSLSGWMITTLPVCVPIMYAASEIKNFDLFSNSLRRLSWVLLAILILNMLGGSEGNMYDMHFSYGLLLVILIHIKEVFDGKKKYFILIVSELVMLLAYGSRGALICIAVYLILKILTNIESTSKKIQFIVLIVALLGVGYFLFISYGIQFYSYLQRMGFSSRTLGLLLQGEFSSHDSGRYELWALVLQLIQRKPFIGWGIRGAVAQMGHPYPHNLFLDLMLAFGIPIGFILSMLVLWQCRKIFTIPVGTKKELTQLFFAHGFVTLMFSGTLFTNYYFFIFLGFTINLYNQSKKVSVKNGKLNGANYE